LQLSGGGMLESTDGGASWQAINTGFPVIDHTPLGEPILDPVTTLVNTGPFLIAGTLVSGLLRTTDGSLWAASNTGLPRNFANHPPTFSAMTLLGTTVLGATTGFASGGENGSGIFRSSDGGMSWTRSDSGIPAGRPVNGIAAAGTTLYATTGIVLNPHPD